MVKQRRMTYPLIIRGMIFFMMLQYVAVDTRTRETLVSDIVYEYFYYKWIEDTSCKSLSSDEIFEHIVSITIIEHIFGIDFIRVF